MTRRALLVIDPQKIYTSRDSELYCKDAAATIDKINSLLKDAKKRGDMVIVVRHEHRRDGTDLGRMFDYLGTPEEDFNFKAGTDEVKLDSRLRVPGSAPEIVKTRYSAFVGTELLDRLRASRVDTVAICGFMTNFCCEATARHAHDLDFFVDFITDATGTPGTEKQSQSDLRSRVADTLAAGYSRVWTTKRWCARANA